MRRSLLIALGGVLLAAPVAAQVTIATEAPGTLACGVAGVGAVRLEAIGPAPTLRPVADIMLVVDGSGSVSADQFAQLKTALAAIVNSFTFGPDDVQMGLVRFSTAASVVFGLTPTRQTALTGIQGIAAPGGLTCIGCGIELADQHLTQNGRPGAARFMIVITDGQNNVEPPLLQNVVQAAHANTTVLAVGVGLDTSLPQLELIASDAPEQTVFQLNDFNSLAQLPASIVGIFGPAESIADFDVAIALNLDPALILSGATATSGVLTVTGNQIQWTFEELLSGGHSLSFTFERGGTGGATVPLFASATYQSMLNSPPVVPNPPIVIDPCDGGGSDLQLIIDGLTADLAACTDAKDALQLDLDEAQGQIASLEASIDGLEDTLSDAQAMIANKDDQIAALQAALDAASTDAGLKGAAIIAAVLRVQADLRETFADATFVIPGATPEQQLQNLIDAVIALNRGRTQGILDALRDP